MFLSLPSERVTTDIHCVTRWSRLDTVWEGVSVDTLLAGVETQARSVVACFAWGTRRAGQDRALWTDRRVARRLHTAAVDRHHRAVRDVEDVPVLAAKVGTQDVERVARLAADCLDAVDVLRREERVDRAAR